MDALMIVHQLQRLAVEPRPAPAVRAKIPRMAVGICYFLEHPDTGVQHQAAGALRLMLQQHHQLLLQSPELKELRAALQQHANSKDVVVSECCTASLALLQQHEQQQEQQQQEQQEQQQEPQQQQSGAATTEETLESLDLFSVVLGLRGLLSCASNRSFLIFKPQSDEHQQQQQRQRMLELLQRDLQLRLVRVWGVSSATVTLNTASLLKQAADIEASAAAAAAQKPQQGEEGDGVAVVSIRLSRRSQRLQQQLRELRAATGPLTLLLSSELVQKAQRPAAERPVPGASSAEGSSSTNGTSGQGSESAKEEGRKQQVQERGYLDEELRNNWGGDEREDGGAPPTANSSNSGFSFFSSNSALFGQSRFMGGMITPTENSAEMVAKLKAEKERKAAMRAQNQGGIIDRLLERLADGHVILYEREVPCELRMQEGSKAPQDVGRLEPIKVKILILGEETSPQEVRVETSSENDLFFHYTHVVDEKAFRQMQQSQKLMIDFADYSQVLMKMLNSCIREPQSFLAVFIMETTGKGRLDFIQNMEYKFIELLSCDFLQSSEEVIRQQMSFRYNSLKSRLALMHARLHDIGALVKVKSPSLLLHLQKSAAQQLHSKKTGLRGTSLNQPSNR
ncbi:hypothetical protein Emag_005983 [Eimeria magna]